MTSLDRIRAIADAAEQADGAAPLDEATWLALRRGEGIRTWERESAVATLLGADLNLVVHPDARGRGRGGGLLDAALAEVGETELHAWSHSDHPAAARLGQTRGFERVRELWVMRRPASRPLPDLVLPDGVVIRGYQDSDAEDLLRVNALAFASHPEQGAMDAGNLAARMAEPWFDPDGLLIAERDGRTVAFHWTKQHDARVGEVYVVGVDPAEQGHGLGRLATLAGLHHLARLGVEEVLLHVEWDNAPAIAVYRDKLGFTHAPEDTHVMYRRGG